MSYSSVESLNQHGCTTRDTFVSSQEKTSHAMQRTREHQKMFATLEKLPISEDVRKSFERKPFSIGNTQ